MQKDLYTRFVHIVIRGEKMEEVTQEEKVELNQEMLSQEIKELIQKAIEKGSEEAKYILRLTLDYDTQKPKNSLRVYYKIIYGKIQEFESEKVYDGNKQIEEYIIIPLTVPVVLLTYDMEGPLEVYVFTTKGWYKLYI